MQGEGYGISDTAIKELRRRYTNVYILFDNDAAGLADGCKLSSQTGFINVVLPTFKGGKDISDFYKSAGKEMFNRTMICLFNQADEDPFNLPF